MMIPTILSQVFQRRHWGIFWRQGGAHMGFSERIDTILIQTELNRTELCLLHRYYNSRLDLPGPIGADYPDGMNATQEYNSNTTQSERIRDLATALARYLFWASTSTEPNATQADMLQADIEDVSCSGWPCRVVSCHVVCPLNPMLHRLTCCRLMLRR